MGLLSTSLFDFKPKTRTILAFICIILCNFIFGLAAVVYKFSMDDLDPIMLAFYRQIGAAVLLMAIVPLSSVRRPALVDLPALVAVGFMGVFLTQTLFILSLQYAGAVLTSILQLVSTPATTALAVWVGLERITVLKSIGLVGSVIGAGVIASSGKSTDTKSSNPLVGICLMLIQCLCLAGWVVLAKKRLFPKYPSTLITSYMHLTGLPWIIFITVYLFAYKPQAFELNSVTGLTVAFSIVVHSAIGYLTLNYANSNLNPSVCAAFSAVNPLSCSVLGVFILHESLGLFHILGGIVICSALGCLIWQNVLDRQKDQVLKTSVETGSPAVVELECSECSYTSTNSTQIDVVETQLGKSAELERVVSINIGLDSKVIDIPYDCNPRLEYDQSI